MLQIINITVGTKTSLRPPLGSAMNKTNTMKVFNHVGLLCNRPPDQRGAFYLVVRRPEFIHHAEATWLPHLHYPRTMIGKGKINNEHC